MITLDHAQQWLGPLWWRFASHEEPNSYLVRLPDVDLVMTSAINKFLSEYMATE